MQLLTFFTVFTVLSSLTSSAAMAKVVHWSADKTKVIRQTKVVELRGNAHFSRDDEDLHADEIDYDQVTQIVNARGRVQYQYGSYFVKADTIDLDLDKKTGVITNGNLTNGSFALRGSKMEQIGENRILVKDYDYTTCLDCPNAWAMTGKEVDLTLDGYAYIKDFVFKVKEAPMFWMPYMIVPVKTRRQTGLLFPRFGVNDIHGIYVVEPAYWAINDWSDMTLGTGYFSKRGARFEWEGRYALTNRSYGIANLYFTRDKEVRNLTYRYAGKLAITQELPFSFEAKFKGNEVSDSGYPITYSEDIVGRYEPVLSSDLFISRNDPNVSTVIAFRRFRNLLNYDSNNKFIPDFDTRTVQEFPRVVVNTNNQFLFGSKVAAGMEVRLNRFSRGAGPFDVIPTSSTTSENVIREANRFTLIPSLYTTLNPFPWLSLVPSVQYRAFLYNFNDAPNYPNLARGYLLTQAEMSFQLEKVVPTSDPNVSFKHTIRPSFTWSAIPSIQESKDHPFFDQIQEKARPGQYFDYWDIVPLNNSQNLDSYFTPLGHSLTYGVTSQVFKKEKQSDGEMRVSRRFEAKALQTINILEAKKFLESGQRDNRIVLSPLFTQLSYSDEKYSASAEYVYYSFLDRYDSEQILTYRSPHRFNANMTWNIEKSIHQGVLNFDRSLSMSYSFSKLISKVSSLTVDLHFSINDYVMPQVKYVFDLMSKPNQILDMRYGLLFQSPSRCWSLDTAITRSIDRGFGFNVAFALNLTGSDFGSLEEQLRKP
jgi:LPS-assembly protein